MKNKLFTLAAALTLVAVLGSIYAAPAFAAAIKAALVKNVDESGRAPFTALMGCSLTAPGLFCSAASVNTVPAGKRFVVEYLSFGITTGEPGIRSVTLSGSSGEIKAHLGAELIGQDANNYDYNSSGPIRVFFEPGETPRISISVRTATELNIAGELVGYLVDLSI